MCWVNRAGVGLGWVGCPPRLLGVGGCWGRGSPGAGGAELRGSTLLPSGGARLRAVPVLLAGAGGVVLAGAGGCPWGTFGEEVVGWEVWQRGRAGWEM